MSMADNRLIAAKGPADFAAIRQIETELASRPKERRP